MMSAVSFKILSEIAHSINENDGTISVHLPLCLDICTVLVF